HPFTSFSFMAVAITSWYAGTDPGLLALLLSYLAITHFSIPARIGGSSSESYLVIYGIFGLLVGWFSSLRRRAERLLTEARDNLELRVAERTSELRQDNEELQSTQAELRSEKDRRQVVNDKLGHEKGAFTGAIAQRVGRLELANNGTLFLDEIGDIPLELQPKLLRVLQEREFERLGSTRTIRTDVRLIAATNRDLAAMVEEQKFR